MKDEVIDQLVEQIVNNLNSRRGLRIDVRSGQPDETGLEIRMDFKTYIESALGEINAGKDREIKVLREIFPRILEATQSGGCSAHCSLEFLIGIPDEVRLAVARLKNERDELARQISDAPHCNTMLPPQFQRLWEACITLSEKAEFKAFLRYTESLEAKIKQMREVLDICLVASCTCLTKTNEVKFHATDCRYRRISEVLEEK